MAHTKRGGTSELPTDGMFGGVMMTRGSKYTFDPPLPVEAYQLGSEEEPKPVNIDSASFNGMINSRATFRGSLPGQEGEFWFFAQDSAGVKITKS